MWVTRAGDSPLNVARDAHYDSLFFIFPLGRRVPNSGLSPPPSSPSPSSWLISPISQTPALGQSPTRFPESLLGPWGLSLCGLTSYYHLSMNGPSFRPSHPCHQKPLVAQQPDAIPASSKLCIFFPCYPQPRHKAPHSRVYLPSLLYLPFLATCYCCVRLTISCTRDIEVPSNGLGAQG